MSDKSTQNKLVITYTKSVIGYNQRQRGTISALGLNHLGDVVEHDDTPVIRGMVNKVQHLVTVEEQAS
ncbi:MAG: 50S ribosomal protein L30 [Chloroflexi bacterium]|nr:50S ribosomal protein L30 [Chloroflexota bacterium]